MAGSAVFVDANVLDYANVAAAPWHTDPERAILDLEAATRDLWISRQVLRE